MSERHRFGICVPSEWGIGHPMNMTNDDMHDAEKAHQRAVKKGEADPNTTAARVFWDEANGNVQLEECDAPVNCFKCNKSQYVYYTSIIYTFTIYCTFIVDLLDDFFLNQSAERESAGYG